MNLVNLYDLSALVANSDLSKRYVAYKCRSSPKNQYKHQEIEGIDKMIASFGFTHEEADSFIYGYRISHLSAEFDLLKITKNHCINIEFKSHSPALGDAEDQLENHQHYLEMIGKELILCTYFSDKDVLYIYKDGKMSKYEDWDRTLFDALNEEVDEEVNLDEVFSAKNILISPLNEPDKFLDREYLLTQHQKDIKAKILDSMRANRGLFYGIKGTFGTGKSLILYDIALDLVFEGKNVLIVHVGKTCDAHMYLANQFDNLQIVPIKSLKHVSLDKVDIILADEAQRIDSINLGMITQWAKQKKGNCIFSYDPNQFLSKIEQSRNSSGKIEGLCTKANIHKLTTKIRTNQVLADFIDKLFHLPNNVIERHYDNVEIFFIKDKGEARKFAEKLEKNGYTYISLTTAFTGTNLDYQESLLNTHSVVGQEFDDVCMIMDDYFYYDGNELKAKPHPYDNYLLTKLLYQGLTRARSKIALIITDESLLGNIMKIYGI